MVDVSIILPIVVSIVVTLAYASIGKLSSGETFDAKKFAETLAVEIVALIGTVFTGQPELIALLPSVLTVLIMKGYAYIVKKREGTI